MALIVEDGTGKADAESYISVADATAYHNALGQGDAWDLIDDQEAALRLATAYMEQAYRMRWKSYRFNSTQRLSWPRAWVQIPDAPYGYGSFAAYVPNNVVPVEVKNACAELALKSNSGSNATALAPDIARATVREKVGPIEVEYDKNAPIYTQYRAIDMMLSAFLAGNGPAVGLVRT